MQALQRSLFDSGEVGGDFTSPQPRFFPRNGLWGSFNLLSYSAGLFHTSHGSTSTFVALPIQTGRLNSDSIANMEFRNLSLSELATLEKSPTHRLTVSEEDYPVNHGFFLPTLEGTQHSQHFKDSLNRFLFNSGTTESQMVAIHVNDEASYATVF